MFDEQNKNSGVEDILASTEAPGSAPMAPPGPPSALASGRLQPVQPGATSPVVPVGQMSSVGHSSFPVKKIIATAIVVLAVGGGAAAGYFWWQGRGQASEGAAMPLSQPESQVAPPAVGVPAADNTIPPPGSPLNQALDQFQQDSINKAIDPFSQPPSGDGNNVVPPQNSTASIDTDQDGLSDADEAVNGTNSRLVDSDADGLSDWEEVTVFGTNPLNSDTDSDNYTDGAEVQNGYSPNGPGKLLDFEKAKSGAQ